MLGILTGVLVGMLFLRNDVEADVLRLPGQLYERKANNRISNVYTYKLLNKTNKDIDEVHFKLMSHKGTIEVVSHNTFTVPAGGLAKGKLFIELNASALSGDKDKVVIGVFSSDKQIETTRTAFLGPRTFN